MLGYLYVLTLAHTNLHIYTQECKYTLFQECFWFKETACELIKAGWEWLNQLTSLVKLTELNLLANFDFSVAIFKL